MVIGAIVLVIGALQIDFRHRSDLNNLVPWFGPLGEEAARRILTTVAATMVTVAGVVFSITVVALQLASGQFGPRLLRNFMSDRGNQIAFGTFTSAFVYCLLALAAVREDPQGFTPVVAVGIGLALGIVGIGVLIYFIHHTVQGIRVEQVVASVAAELEEALDHLFPESIGEEPAGADGESRTPIDLATGSRPIRTTDAGYIQTIDADGLVETAKRCELLLVLERRPGDFVCGDMVLALAYPIERVSDDAVARIAACFTIGIDRNPRQDPRFVAQQLTQIALRALSPAINDPFSAVECINRLAQGFRRAAARCRPSEYRFDASGRLLVVAPRDTLLPIALAAFDPIARACGDDVSVVVRLLEAVGLILEKARYAEDREELLAFAQALEQESRKRLTRASDRALVEQACAPLAKLALTQPVRR